MNSWLQLVGGLVALVLGAEFVVRAGTRLAVRWSIPPVVIGLTIVSLGTSAPELAIGIDAALRGTGALAVGNLVGTNLVNLLLILGMSAILVPIAVTSRITRIDAPAMVIAALLGTLAALDGRFTPLEGAILLLAGLVYMAVTLRTARDGDSLEPVADSAPGQSGATPTQSGATPAQSDTVSVRAGTESARPGTVAVVLDLLVLAIALAVIVVGADQLVMGSVEVARDLGVSEAMIGLTIIAVGTSAPELATTLISTLRGNRDIALGNLLGSSVLNIAIILGATILAASEPIDIPGELAHIDARIMAAAAILALPLLRTGHRFTRLEGVCFVLAYLIYFIYLLLTRL